jgi:DNA repair protein RadC
VHPREVFRVAIINGAARIICLHNHPSGDPEPSVEDKAMTERLKETGKIIGINLLDHIIVCQNRYVSFADRGLL